MTFPEMKIKLTGKGQLTIPWKVRQQLGLSDLSEVELVIEGDNATLHKFIG
jgi:bifunctional DNA-binding transcriptional regulator/antitoxin component of YhaV-PrlF toxin-antitoxin module